MHPRLGILLHCLLTSAAVIHAERLCKAKYDITTWDGTTIPSCDENVCKGKDGLETMKRPSNMDYRMTKVQKASALEAIRNGKIQRALNTIHLQHVGILTEWQHAAGVFGSVGEMGVHHGGFTIALLASSLKQEPAVAVDLFNDQHLNVDGSGYVKTGNLGPFSHNIGQVGLNCSELHLFSGDTMLLTGESFSKRGLTKFRFLSVDAGHTLELTLHDLMLASCVVAEGGIVVLDDFINGQWMGVFQAAVHFTTTQDRLVPFMWSWNKLYFTTRDWHETYLNKILKSQDFACNLSKTHASRWSLNEFKVCA
jgi:hypothetical protein